MKRQIANVEGVQGLDMADCLIMLSQARDNNPHKSLSSDEVLFECKTCNRKFTSFQALGGHRASHKRPKLDDGERLKAQAKSLGLGIGDKPKMHECSICGQRFSLGQALGGHMRKHTHAINEGLIASMNQVVAKVPVLKRSDSTRAMCLDLNLTPLENDLKLLFGTMAPKVNISF